MARSYLETEIHISRIPEDVFAAWTTSKALASWFAPMAIEKPVVDWEFRVGGRYAIRMVLPDNRIFTTVGMFREIVENTKIVMTWRCDAFPDAATLVTVLFDADESGTNVRIKHEHFESDDTCANHRHGWELCLSKLGRFLEAS